MVKYLMVMMVAVGVCASSDEKNHNGEEHLALCSVLSAAVTIFQSGRGGPTLQKALRRALFGKENGVGDISTLLAELPRTHHNPESRKSWCGECRYYGDPYPGWSIPHDLLCLCTVGENGHPFNSYGSVSQLCGRSVTELGCDHGQRDECHTGQGKGWSTSSTGESARRHVEATWESVVKTCLKKGLNLTVEEARKTLGEKLTVEEHRSAAWERSHYYCGGDFSGGGICVSYNLCGKNGYLKQPHWLEDVYDALLTANFNLPPSYLNTTGFSNTTFDEGEDGDERGPNGDSHNGTHHGSSSTRRRRKRSNHAVSHLFKEDGTLLTHPLLWILSAAFLF
ncbi:Variant surface glycoprotein [Trypanosoma congolense IL3000]|uniref:Variant surface glycoprotein n=1 Tax=Trypanosoma congolense (strain IL3000) TaxID=1068625 RepID=F9W4B2_TRYCI|nr:Variant surface glycoprotein [Trypanosoma congolense IL3000]CCD16241.1 Variant surface glycoprotein [Trypanosoma congolense IL3000]